MKKYYIPECSTSILILSFLLIFQLSVSLSNTNLSHNKSRNYVKKSKSLIGNFMKEGEVNNKFSNKIETNNNVESTLNKVYPPNINKRLLTKGKGFFDPLGIEAKNTLVRHDLEVKKCDDVIEFEAEYIFDLTDFRRKKKAFFSINVYRISMFEDKSVDKLIHSVLLSSITQVPQILLGGKGCISIDSGSVTAQMTICMGTKLKAQKILDQLQKFDRCRAGDNLVVIPPAQMEELQKICNDKNNSTIGLKNPANKVVNLKVRPGNKWDMERDKFLHPDNYIVPGALSLG